MSILRRTVYYGDVDSSGAKRFLDFAIVTTTIGEMVEPFIVNQKHTPSQSFETHDPADEINRIDSVENIDLRNYTTLLSFGDASVLHGGDINPRVGGTK